MLQLQRILWVTQGVHSELPFFTSTLPYCVHSFLFTENSIELTSPTQLNGKTTCYLSIKRSKCISPMKTTLTIHLATFWHLLLRYPSHEFSKVKSCNCSIILILSKGNESPAQSVTGREETGCLWEKMVIWTVNLHSNGFGSGVGGTLCSILCLEKPWELWLPGKVKRKNDLSRENEFRDTLWKKSTRVRVSKVWQLTTPDPDS